jgi:hypothetical protein
MKKLKCDACSIADAQFLAVKGRKALLFCLHHTQHHLAALQRNGWTVMYKEKGGKK